MLVEDDEEGDLSSSFCAYIQLVQQIRAKFDKNCGFCGKSTKLGTMIVHDMANNIGYGAHLDLSHNSNWSRFIFAT